MLPVTKKLINFSKKCRIDIVHQSMLKKSGHLGGCLSAIDLINVVYNKFNIDNKKNTFTLSKGHCALALYAVLKNKKIISNKEFQTYATDKTLFGEHPSPSLKKNKINFASGSLGHGIGYASGVAYSNKLKKVLGKSFVLIGDGELNEGSCWESIMLAAKLKLDNMYVFIDYNKWQATGRSNQILDLEPLKEKFKSFGWACAEVDGHNIEKIIKTIKILKKEIRKPKIIIAHTVKGKGVSFMEDDNNWHYRSPTNLEFEQAKIEILS